MIETIETTTPDTIDGIDFDSVACCESCAYIGFRRFLFFGKVANWRQHSGRCPNAAEWAMSKACCGRRCLVCEQCRNVCMNFPSRPTWYCRPCNQWPAPTAWIRI